jgi:hypothetical protein
MKISSVSIAAVLVACLTAAPASADNHRPEAREWGSIDPEGRPYDPKPSTTRHSGKHTWEGQSKESTNAEPRARFGGDICPGVDCPSNMSSSDRGAFGPKGTGNQQPREDIQNDSNRGGWK